MKLLIELLISTGVVNLLMILWLALRSASATRELCGCPRCGARMKVTPEPAQSRLAAHCREASCGHRVLHPIRASALSFFGLNTFLLAAIAGVAGVVLGQELHVPALARLLAGTLAFGFGFAVARFLVRLVACAVLTSGAPPIWLKEAVAHLASPPSP